MSKKTFGSIIEKPNGTLYVKYIERYEVLADGTRKQGWTNLKRFLARRTRRSESTI